LRQFNSTKVVFAAMGAVPATGILFDLPLPGSWESAKSPELNPDGIRPTRSHVLMEIGCDFAFGERPLRSGAFQRVTPEDNSPNNFSSDSGQESIQNTIENLGKSRHDRGNGRS
jgi:hypothetical protein